MNLRKAHDSVKRDVLYNILIDFGNPVIALRLSETYMRVRVGKHLSDIFTFLNGLKLGDALSQLLFKFALEFAI
jgi:hypothetical protein